MSRATLFLEHLDARDCAAFERWAREDMSRLVRVFWLSVTRLGGATVTLGIPLASMLAPSDALRGAGKHATFALVVTHLLAQALKRTITRPRPTERGHCALADVPDRYSFPSGHATAASALAFAYALWFPSLAPLLFAVAALVGVSRVRLGVHYPRDVIVGQLIAIAGAAIAPAVL